MICKVEEEKQYKKDNSLICKVEEKKQYKKDNDGRDATNESTKGERDALPILWFDYFRSCHWKGFLQLNLQFPPIFKGCATYGIYLNFEYCMSYI